VPRMDETTRTCHWCSTPIPTGETACPKCGAAAEGVAGEIPGLTTIDPRAPRGALPEMVPNPIEWLRAGKDPAGNNSAYKVPSEDVLREMRKMELEAEVLNAETTLLDPFGEPLVDAVAPSDEATAPQAQGPLDGTGPAGEKELGELGDAWGAGRADMDSKGSSRLG
jgi:hypothetical protein